MRRSVLLVSWGVGCVIGTACAHRLPPYDTVRPQCGRPIPKGCPEGPDDDLCPGRGLTMEPGCRLAAAAAGNGTNDETFREVVAQMREEPRLTAISIVVTDPACGEMLRGRLVSLGADTTRIQVRPPIGKNPEDGASFEVAAWKGAACDPEVFRKVPFY